MTKQINGFQKTIWAYYYASGRSLPWREPEPDGSFDPYKIMVSEIMLQQTQANRVIPKYREFLAKFPNSEALSRATLAEVIRAWSGLGYNRRAKYLHDAAKTITNDCQGRFPQILNTLTVLPGIGANTAAAILVYTYNQPLVFIETNIRSVYIHHFFAGQTNVTDKQLLPVIEKTLDKKQPREWYWALMDYGSYLKTTEGNASRSSRHYKKQSAFKGSVRELRGAILRELAAQPMTLKEISSALADERTAQALESLIRDNLVQKTANSYCLAE
jgi:A/G-specific adenine glycosylase